MIDTLTELINCLYPDPPPGILVLGNGNPPIPPTRTRQVITAIANAQRINRDNGSELVGLCEFHIGIIYMHWDAFYKAQQQFVLALRHWNYTPNNTTILQAIGLAHFANGYAQEQEFSYEDALSNYRVAGKCLHATPETDCVFSLQAITKEREVHVHKQIFTSLTNTPSPPRSRSQAHQTDSNTTTQQSNSNPSLDNTRPPDSQPDAPMPVINMNTDERQFSPLFSPIPNHTNNGPYKWYSVHNIENDSFLDIETDTYLLVDTSHADKYNEDEWLLIKNGDNGGSVTLRPFPPKAPFERIYLAEVIQIGIFERGIFNGTVKFSPTHERNNIKQLDVIGIVIGIWQSQIHITT